MPPPSSQKSTRFAYILLALYIAASLSYFLANVSGFIDNYFDLHHRPETPFTFDADTLQIQTVRPEAKQAGLGVGDILVQVMDKPYAGQAPWLNLIRTRLHPGDTLSVRVRKQDGTRQTLRFRLAARSSGNHGRFREWGGILLAFSLPPFICLLVGYWVVAARPRDLNAWLILFILTFPETLFSIGVGWWPGWPSFWIVVWMQFQQALSPLALLLFGIYFPERWNLDRQHPWLKYVFIAPLTASVPIFLWQVAHNSFAGAMSARQELFLTWVGRVDTVFAMACICIYFIALQAKLRARDTAADTRRRLRVLMIGSEIGLGAMLLAFVILPLFHIDVQHNWIGIAAGIIFLGFPFSLAYVIVVQRAMDVRILLRIGTKYALARATLTFARAVLAVALVLSLVFILRAPTVTPRAIIEMAVLAGLLLLLQSRFVRNLSNWLDRRFFREAYNSDHLLAELSNQVRKYNDSGTILQLVTESLARTLHIDKIAVMLRGAGGFDLQQERGLELAAVAAGPGSIRLPLNSTTIRNLTRINSPVKLYRENPDGWLLLASHQERQLLDDLSAELLLPLPGREQMMGLIALGPKRSEEPYTPSDLRLLDSVATQTGLALEIGELARSLASAAAQRARIEREIEVAREVQERLFPQEIPVLEGVSLAGHCRPAQGVGGDYYDLFPLDDGRIGIAIGDVSGKGISAALLMASLRASLRGTTLDAPKDMAPTLEKINRLVYEASASNRYATFFFATLNPQTSELTYVNAGHNAPFLLRRCGDGFDVRRLEAGGPVVGLLPVASYEEQRLQLAPGDLLLTYTDGISEAMTTAEEEWGEERMLAAAEVAFDQPAAKIVEAMLAAADAFTGSAPQFDDMTLLVLKMETAASA